MLDYVLNGQAHGSGVAGTLLKHGFNTNVFKPWVEEDGSAWYLDYAKNAQSGKMEAVSRRLTTNTVDAALRKDDWLLLDTAVMKASKPRLRAVADFRGAGLEFNIPNGFGKTVLQYESQTDITGAVVSMDGMRRSQNQRVTYDLHNLPLPIIHKDFGFSARQIEASRNGGSPLDTTHAELASRAVAEEAEKMFLGTSDYSTFSFGGGVLYGLTNTPVRLLKTMTHPVTGSGWTPAVTVQEVLAMKLQSQQAYHFGPWMLYNSPNWDQFLDDDYSAAKGDNTLRERLKKIEGIQDVRTLDYLTGYRMILVQMTPDVARIVVGMEIITIQWPEQGGMWLNFKVMAIMVPQLRADSNDNTGIVDGTAS